MMMELDETPHSERIIRKIYTPKEIRKIIETEYNNHVNYHKLTRSESLLLWHFANQIWRYFYD